MCRPSKTDDRCEIMLLHLLKTLMVYLYANNCAEGLHFSAFIYLGLQDFTCKSTCTFVSFCKQTIKYIPT